MTNMNIGIAIKPTIGIGDALQFSSLFENYYRTMGKKLYAMDQHWFLDHNPYVLKKDDAVTLDKVVQMWNFSPTQWEWPVPKRKNDDHKPKVYLSNAEIWATLLGVSTFLNRPRLYQFEDYPYERREMILLHTNGVSHGEMPPHVVEHVIKKYEKTGCLFRIGNPKPDIYKIPVIQTPTLWDLANVISKAKMLIGVDSAPSWIAACYPDVIVKKLRTKPNPPELFEDWIPLDIRNIHSHWDDRCHQIYNASERDYGFTYSYKRI